MEGAPDMAGHKTGCFSESSLRPIPTPEYSRKYFSGWVFGGLGRDWCWSVFTVCWFCFEKGLGAVNTKSEVRARGKNHKNPSEHADPI